ncbi:MAG: signal peptidase I [bacterium]|nr:signal peptidase I [bacterium]
MKAIFLFIVELAKIVLIAIVIVVPIRAFVFQPFLVRGDSMQPNFANGDYLIVEELSYRFRDPKRGETVVFRFPQNPSSRYIKRIIGLPGEAVQIRNNQIIIETSLGSSDILVLNETSYLPGAQTVGSSRTVLGKDEYFVLGDNRQFSSDSRQWGILPEDHIIGRALLRVFPVQTFAKFSIPQYE